jgi:hypothetical protein
VHSRLLNIYCKFSAKLKQDPLKNIDMTQSFLYCIDQISRSYPVIDILRWQRLQPRNSKSATHPTRVPSFNQSRRPGYTHILNPQQIPPILHLEHLIQHPHNPKVLSQPFILGSRNLKLSCWSQLTISRPKSKLTLLNCEVARLISFDYGGEGFAVDVEVV